MIEVLQALLEVISLLAGLGFLLMVGNSLLLLLSPVPDTFSPLEVLVYSLGLGSLGLTWWMLALSGLGIPLSEPVVSFPWLGMVILIFLFNRYVRKIVRPFAFPRESSASLPTEPFSGWDWLFLSLLAVLFSYATLRAGLYPVWAWDAYATWAFKAKVFYVNRSISLQGFEAHNYYPNLVPLILTYLYLFLGQVNDHLVKLVFPLYGAALLALLCSLLLRMGLTRRRALGLTAFFALSGATFITHLYIAYADLILTFFTLAAAGLMYLRLTGAAPPGSMPVLALMCAGMAWSKFEGAPLAATIVLAAALTLAWLRPPQVWRRLAELAWPLFGILLGALPWRLYLWANHMEVGSDHVLSLFPHQFFKAIPSLLWHLANPYYFGLLWWTLAAALIILGRHLVTSPRFFLALFIGGNLVAILLGYALAPTDPFEFPLYIRATLDRLLLHIAPLAALLVGEGLKELGEGARGQGAPAPSPKPPPPTP